MFHKRCYRTRPAGIVWQLGLILAFATTAIQGQERQYTIGSSVDLVGGSDSSPVNSSVGGLATASTRSAGFYSFYPAISLTTSGARSTLRATYTVGLVRTRSDVDYNSLSNGGTLAFSQRVASRWSLSLNESFLATNDATSFNGLRGTTPSPDQFRFLFDPSALRLSSHSNTAGISTEYTLTPRSSLSFSATHGLRNYANGASILNGSLMNQQFVTGGITYTQKTSATDAWSAGYTASYFSFQNFGNMASHTGFIGYSAAIAPDVTLQLTVGASRMGSLGNPGFLVNSLSSLGTAGSYVGYNTLVSISKKRENDSFSVRYRQDTGQPSGLGSVSNIRQASAAVGHKFKTITLFLDASVFDASDGLTTLQTRGVSATASIGIPLSQTLSVHGGAEYQKYDEAGPFGFQRQRFFVTLRYNDPKLWTIFR